MKCFAVLLTVFGVVAAAFDDDLSRNGFYPLAAAAYSTYPDRCVANLFTNATVTKTVNADCGNGAGELAVCYGYAGVVHDQKAVFLVYRGTTEALQLVYESYRTLFVDMVASPLGGKVSNYFHGVYENLKGDGLNDAVKQLADAYPSYTLWITGHSLGGALASVAAGELIKLDGIASERVNLITFGQPREGNKEYASNFAKVVTNVYRVVNQADIVPHLPPKDLFDYYHHSAEVWFASGMGKNAAYKKCDQAESSSCSNSLIVAYNVFDHVVYYDNFVVGYGYTACVGVDTILNLIKGL